MEDKKIEIKQHYGLLTALSMIVGICVGSGIFFKSDDILAYTGGDVLLGVLVFCIGALCVIFGSITLTELASRTEKTGGVVGYFEEFISPAAASAFGWFQVWVYFPTITVVVAWVAGIYTTMLFNLPSTLETQVGIGLIYLTFLFGMNYISLKAGGRFQNLTTFIKLIPLIGIGLVGLFWSAPNPEIPNEVAVIGTSSVGLGWLAALAPMAFSFEGWVISTTITPEVKNAKRNMPIALTIGPLIVLVVYLAYFLGTVSIVGEEYILSTGDAAISQIGTAILGANGESIMLTFVLIAVLGVVNGLTLGYIRLPQALATKNMIPMSDSIKVMDAKRELSPASTIFAFVVSLVWMGLHYISQKTSLLSGGDISEIAIVFSYLAYAVLYLKVIQLKREGVIKNVFLGYVAPVLGTLGSLVILVGGIFSNPTFVPFFLIFSLLVCIAGFVYYQKKNQIAS
ncbi:amino acid permease [Marinilactibacillus sp. XAAS-LB27]|uniref:APC family permease n=1 Tax=Marinilactibacillus sp. XAAS-LB27 TaxID=3114538 RepID=UPI002E187BAC|nr:amino acid permease [Marinilactibacillus sp. XAAS-LB27]